MMHPPDEAAAQCAATDGRTGRSRQTAADSVGVAAVAVIEADAAELAHLRADFDLASEGGRALRHAHEQTVLALAAVRRAADAGSLGPFDDWGVVVSPRWQGRSGAMAFIEKYHAIGVRGIAPHAIPSLCLHAGAATVSLCLAARGPVFGAGGGPAYITDGLLAALAVQLVRNTPGTWLALTEWDGDESAGHGRAVSLALVPARDRNASWTLSMRPKSSPSSQVRGTGAGAEEGNKAPFPRLTGLIDFVTRPAGRRWDCPLDGGGEFSLTAEETP